MLLKYLFFFKFSDSEIVVSKMKQAKGSYRKIFKYYKGRLDVAIESGVALIFLKYVNNHEDNINLMIRLDYYKDGTKYHQTVGTSSSLYHGWNSSWKLDNFQSHLIIKCLIILVRL